ncbi:peptidoglycan-binding protein [Streptomyces guryensis]|uniref:Peptidoglycan-binding protein n=1 Tax=Streptomyces guryensis TaxID=2886947 RepID=A0A9Q3VHX9_9ACTN|nr:peptidoglycan-binding protein [Streptomyces guryensis]MCD9872122.1 peptidoglycan-binding protein [Streptomyces guryensis]
MAAPVFEEFDPANDCDCPGCAHWRSVLPYSRAGRHPAARRAVIVAAAASAALGAGHVAPALAAPHVPPGPGVSAGSEVATPQGHRAPLHGRGGPPLEPASAVKLPETTRAEIITRARTWVDAKVPYSMEAYWYDGYRQDCSGYVSMAWGLPGNEWTGSLKRFGERVAKEELQPGDILLFHNPQNPERGSHVVIFGGWKDSTRTSYLAYEQRPPQTRRKDTPYAYWHQSDRYVPYRYKGLKEDAAGPDKPKPPAAATTPYPGAAYFGPGANNKYVTQLGQMLVTRGAGRYYTMGPGPRWSDADRRATGAFQLAQGWKGAESGGLPGPLTWDLLVSGKGKDIAGVEDSDPQVPSSHGVQGYPGRAMFRPGASNPYVTQLGEQLVKKGFDKYYTTDPGPDWDEEDRRNVEDFQRSQGWRGGAADGVPGPETWRRLFS